MHGCAGRKRGKYVLADAGGLRHDRVMASRASSATRPRQVAIVAYPGVQSLDITGPLEVFFGANTLIGRDSPRCGCGSLRPRVAV